MRNLIFFLALVGFLSQSSLADEYKNPKKGFSVVPAADWEVKATPDDLGLNLVVRFPNEEDPFSPSFQVTVWNGEHTINDWFERQKQTLQGTADQELKLEKTELAGKKAGAFTYTINNALKTRTVYTFANGKTYTVSKSGRVADFDKHPDAFKQMFETFKITK